MRRLILLVPLLVILIGSSASPVTLRRMHLDETLRHADAVFVGTVDRQWCERSVDRPKLIVTKVAFKDLTVLHGTVKGSELVLTFAGGRLGDQGVLVPGMPTFTNGERTLLVVGIDRTWPCPIIGWWQGRFGIEKDAESGRTIVRDGRGRRVGGVANGRVVLRPDGDEAFSLDDLVREVRALLTTEPEDPETDTGEDDR